MSISSVGEAHRDADRSGEVHRQRLLQPLVRRLCGVPPRVAQCAVWLKVKRVKRVNMKKRVKRVKRVCMEYRVDVEKRVNMGNMEKRRKRVNMENRVKRVNRAVHLPVGRSLADAAAAAVVLGAAGGVDQHEVHLHRRTARPSICVVGMPAETSRQHHAE